jgi:hypothetical protein
MDRPHGAAPRSWPSRGGCSQCFARPALVAGIVLCGYWRGRRDARAPDADFRDEGKQALAARAARRRPRRQGAGPAAD